ncbi:MAG: ParB family chromosome partitioning protein [Candidatus Azotimanducaceae bacterium]|jgi:ParB family chromosome partitioning protein
MSKKHDAIFDDVLSGLDGPSTAPPAPSRDDDRAGARFLKRSTTLGDRLSGDLEEKTLHWVDPADCQMWQRHNRDYGLLTQDNCSDLIDGIKSQGRQEFPAIVRRIEGDKPFEVICGARRHFAVSWLRGNNYPQFKYLIEVRDLTDEEAFRLADIENRDREDISDFERAIDYAHAIDLYYGGRQKAMADRLEVSAPWLSRYVQMAKLPSRIVQAFASIRDIKERHARDLKPMLADPKIAKSVLAAADKLAVKHLAARDGHGTFMDGADVMIALKKAGRPEPVSRKPPVDEKTYKDEAQDKGIVVRNRGTRFEVEIDKNLSKDAVLSAFHRFINENF